MNEKTIDQFGKELMKLVEEFKANVDDERVLIAIGLHFFTTYVLCRTNTVKEGVDFIFDGVKRSTEQYKKNIRQ